MSIMNRLLNHSVFIGALMSVSCLPIPFPRTTITQPQMTITVLDSKQHPVADATIWYLIGSDPHSRLHQKMKFKTNSKGQARLEQQETFEWILPLMMHGVPFYYWAFCVDKEGFDSKIEKIHNHKAKKITIVLEKSTSNLVCSPEPAKAEFYLENRKKDNE